MDTENIKKVICSCGMDNELILKNGVLCYNQKKHGNGSPCLGKCFNCHQPLSELQEKDAKAKDDPAAGKTDGPEEPIDYNKFGFSELKKMAKAQGIEFDKRTTKPELVAFLSASVS